MILGEGKDSVYVQFGPGVVFCSLEHERTGFVNLTKEQTMTLAKVLSAKLKKGKVKK